MASKIDMRRWMSLGIPAVFFMLLVLFMGIGLGQVSADLVPDPLPPHFEGTYATAQFNAPNEDANCSVNTTNIDVSEGYTQTFELGLDTGWVACDNNGLTDGEYYWGTDTFSNGPSITGTRSVWSLGSGEQGGALDPISDTYPSSADSWLIFGPFDLSIAQDASIEFDYWLDKGSDDTFGVFTSNDGSSFTGLISTVGTIGWETQSFTLNSELGNESVYIGFNFVRDGAADSEIGAVIDNVVINVTSPDALFLPIVRLDPTPTPSVPQTIREGFEDDPAEWVTVRRRNTGTVDNTLRFAGTGDRYVEAEVKSTADYIILSSLEAGPQNNFEIDVLAEFANKADKHGYSIIFGGDYSGVGSSCPNGNLDGCFSNYYALRVRWRTGDVVQYNLTQVTSHTGDNQPVDVSLSGGWNEVSTSTADGDGTIHWEVIIGEDGSIEIQAENTTLRVIDGPRTFNGRYFGLGMNTESIGNSRVKFYRIDVVDRSGSTNPNPGNSYDAQFTDSTQSWEDSRHDIFKTTDNRVTHSDENGGIMIMEVNDEDQYFIASPMVEAPNPTYTIDTSIDISGSPEDRQEYNIIFGGNASDSDNCLNDTLDNCFNQYYGLRVRWRENNGNPILQARLSEAATHNTDNNQPEWTDNTDWVELDSGDVETNGYNDWTIVVESNRITVSVNGQQIISDDDSSYTGQPYFGILIRTGDADTQARLKVDYFTVSN